MQDYVFCDNGQMCLLKRNQVSGPCFYRGGYTRFVYAHANGPLVWKGLFPVLVPSAVSPLLEDIDDRNAVARGQLQRT
jgi:hypothetical protein